MAPANVGPGEAVRKLRHGSFFLALLEPRRRIDRILWAVIHRGLRARVSIYKIDDVVAALGIDVGVSKSQVSRIRAELHGAVLDFREHRLNWKPTRSRCPQADVPAGRFALCRRLIPRTHAEQERPDRKAPEAQRFRSDDSAGLASQPSACR